MADDASGAAAPCAHHTSLRQPEKEHQHTSILNKSDLAGEVSQESGLSNNDAKLAIEKLFELIARHLANGDEVNLAGFGKLTVTERAARQGRNPHAATSEWAFMHLTGNLAKLYKHQRAQLKTTAA